MNQKLIMKMELNNIIDYIKTLNLSTYKHASNILAKHNNWDKLSKSQKGAFPLICREYYSFLAQNNTLIGYNKTIIKQRVNLLNTYYNFISENNYDNTFTAQSKFRSTILEEFMYILFKDLIQEKIEKLNILNNNLKVGSSRAYTNLFFSGLNFAEFIATPQIGINQKDQDFAIYRPIDITIGNSNVITTNLPVIAIENKTYIDKTMLEGSIATAEKIKSGNPYALFFIVAEKYDVDLKIDPIYSKINQIYVLRKCKRNSTTNNPIYTDVVIDLVDEVKNHLNRNWSDVSKKLNNTGKII